MTKAQLLRNLDFGQSVAEQEIDQLHKYFVETKEWADLLSGVVDIVYGPKGSGKSALYTLLNDNEHDLFQKQIVLRFAENPRGATAFSELKVHPPASEIEFINLWKLYLLELIGEHFAKYGTCTPEGSDVVNVLKESGLLHIDTGLKAILARTRTYIRKYFNPDSFEPKVEFDSQFGVITGASCKVTFREPSEALARIGALSVDTLLHKADIELHKSDFLIWFLLDRLDVAFADSQELESNALRALFKVYLDFSGYKQIRLKIFLRSDIWRRITKFGFREATHITRNTTIMWDRQLLLNLIIRRFLNNPSFLEFYNVSRDEILKSSDEQNKLFFRIFPGQIDLGNNPDTLGWIIGRTSDASGTCSPRDVINLLRFSLQRQVKFLEVGNPEPEGEILFTRSAIKEALSDASREKIEKHFFAEYPAMRPFLEKLRGGKSQYSLQSLSATFELGTYECQRHAQELVDIGFFERSGESLTEQYWIPFIFRDGLNISQGQSD